MIYIITRTSIFDDEIKPIEDAIETEIHSIDKRTARILDHDKRHIWEKFNKLCRDIKFVDDHYEGVRIKPQKVWIYDIDDMRKFVDKYGDVVISKCECEEGYYVVEIYDTYRE